MATTQKAMPGLGPRGHWFFGCMDRVASDPLSFYMEAYREYGDVVRIHAAYGIHFYLISHPDHVEHVLVKNHKNYRKPDIVFRPIRLMVGTGLFSSEGDFWLRQRRMTQPAFHRQHLARLAPRMVAAAEGLAREWERAGDAVLDVAEAMTRLSLRIAGETLFSTDISGDVDTIGTSFRTGLEYVSYRMNRAPWTPLWLPTEWNRRFKEAKKVMDRQVLDLIAKRRRHPAEGQGDLLSLYLAAQDEETGLGMTDQQLKDEVLTLLLAGSDTVSAGLSWTWYLLGKHPEIQQRVADEVRGVLGGRSPAVDDLPKLPLTRAAFDEALRLYPPAWGVARQTIADDELGGVKVPRGSVMTINQWVTHRRPDLWDEPEAFRPERFLGDAAAERPKFAYFPFGGGPRVCIGNTFALMEGPLVLATLIQKFAMELDPGHEVVPDPTFTLRPKTGVRARLRPRGGEPGS